MKQVSWILVSLFLAAPAWAAPKSPKAAAEQLRKAVAKHDKKAIAAALPRSGLIRVTSVSTDDDAPNPSDDKSPAAVVDELADPQVTVGKKITCKADCCAVAWKVYPEGKEDFSLGTVALTRICVGATGVTAVHFVPVGI